MGGTSTKFWLIVGGLSLLIGVGLGSWLGLRSQDNSSSPAADQPAWMNLAARVCPGEKIYQDLADALKRPAEVCVLDLSDQGLAELPEGLEQFTSLKILDLTGNQLPRTEVPRTALRVMLPNTNIYD